MSNRSNFLTQKQEYQNKTMIRNKPGMVTGKTVFDRNKRLSKKFSLYRFPFTCKEPSMTPLDKTNSLVIYFKSDL